MIRLAKLLMLCVVMILSPTPVSAQEAESLTKQDLEFLEFLGEWEIDGGQWVNPMDFLDNPGGEVEETTGKKDILPELGTDGVPDQRGEYEW